MKSRGHQEDVLLTVCLTRSSYSWCFACAEGASVLTVTTDCICLDSLPSQYSAHEGVFFLFSANKPIPGHNLKNISTPDMRTQDLWVCVWLSGVWLGFFFKRPKHTLWQICPQALAAAGLSPTLWGLRANWLKRSHAYYSLFKVSRRTCLSAILML